MDIPNSLKYALQIIEGYEMELRNSEHYEPLNGINVAATGLCQGSIYKEARQRILEMFEREAANVNR